MIRREADSLVGVSTPWHGTATFSALLGQLEQAILQLPEDGDEVVEFARSENIEEWEIWDRNYELVDIIKSFNHYVRDKYGPRYLVKRSSIINDDGTYHYRFLVKNFLKTVEEGGLIPSKDTDLEQIISALSELSKKPVEVQKVALAAIGDIMDHALSSDPKSWVEREKARRSRPTADVNFPDSPPEEFWNNSKEKVLAESGDLKLDGAIIGFTRRVYQDYLPGNCSVGMAISDYKEIDKPLYDQWVGLRKRINGRKDGVWPPDFPFQSKHSRNDFILDNIQSGNFLPPANPNVYASLRSVARQRYDMNLDDYLPKGASVSL